MPSHPAYQALVLGRQKKLLGAGHQMLEPEQMFRRQIGRGPGKLGNEDMHQVRSGFILVQKVADDGFRRSSMGAGESIWVWTASLRPLHHSSIIMSKFRICSGNNDRPARTKSRFGGDVRHAGLMEPLFPMTRQAASKMTVSLACLGFLVRFSPM